MFLFSPSGGAAQLRQTIITNSSKIQRVSVKARKWTLGRMLKPQADNQARYEGFLNVHFNKKEEKIKFAHPYPQCS